MPSSGTAVAAALVEHDGVLALGGGAVLDAGTRALLARAAHRLAAGRRLRRARTAWASTSRDRCCWATCAAGSWPCCAERGPLYAEVARLSVDTDGRTPEEVADARAGRARRWRPRA